MEADAPGPIWTLDALEVTLEGRDRPSMMRVRFGMIDHAPERTSGEVWENEGLVFAVLNLERDIFVALQAAAFSARALTLFVTFNSTDGAPPSVMLAIEPQWSDA